MATAQLSLRKRLIELLSLPLIAVKTAGFQRQEEKKVRQEFYKNPIFASLDQKLQKAYRWSNPYRLSRAFLEKRSSATEVHTYGETPLSALYPILLSCGLSEKDTFMDLGCGRGRVALFASTFFGCKTIGVDFVPAFIEKAKQLHSSCTFLLEDMENILLNEVSVLYFNALCLEEETFSLMLEKLKTLPSHATVLTVSFPLSDYSSAFTTTAVYPAVFPFGATLFYVNKRTDPQKVADLSPLFS